MMLRIELFLIKMKIFKLVAIFFTILIFLNSLLIGVLYFLFYLNVLNETDIPVGMLILDFWINFYLMPIQFVFSVYLIIDKRNKWVPIFGFVGLVLSLVTILCIESV